MVVVRRAEEGRSKGDKVVGSGWGLGGFTKGLGGFRKVRRFRRVIKLIMITLITMITSKSC